MIGKDKKLSYMFYYLAYKFDNFLFTIKKYSIKYKITLYPNIDSSVNIGTEVRFLGSTETFHIGPGTYINEAILATGVDSIIKIGSYCAIGYRVSIKASTHDKNNPTPSKNSKLEMLNKDIVIGNHCWIGDNVFIREGVVLGDHVIVGANSVVTKSFPDNVVIAGVPAKIISHLKK